MAFPPLETMTCSPESRCFPFPTALRPVTAGVLTLVLAAAPALANGPSSALDCLQPLASPTLENAVSSVKQLKRLAVSETGAARESTEHLAMVVQNLFSAERRLSVAQSALTIAEKSAQKREEKARAWLTPSPFGGDRKILYDNQVRAIREDCQRATQATGNARAQLALAVRDVNVVAQRAAGSGQTEIAALLKGAADTVAERSLEVPEPATLSPDEFASQLLGLALLGLVAAGMMSAASTDSGAQGDGEEKRWADAETAAENGRRWFERANYDAQSRGASQPFPGYDSRP